MRTLPDPRLYVAWVGRLLLALEAQGEGLDVGAWVQSGGEWQAGRWVGGEARGAALQGMNSWDPGHPGSDRVTTAYLHGLLDARGGFGVRKMVSMWYGVLYSIQMSRVQADIVQRLNQELQLKFRGHTVRV